MGSDSECKPCPKYAECFEGNVYCKGDKRFIRGECIYDKKELDMLEAQMEQYSKSLLAQRCAQFECQKYTLYNYLYDDPDIERIDDIYLSEEALSLELAKALQLDSESHLFQNVFEKFTKRIKDEENHSIYLKDLEFKRETGYFSNKPSKSLLCHFIIFWTKNCLIIIPLLTISTFITFWSIKKRRKRLEKQRRRQIAMDRKDQIIDKLKNFMMNSNQKWIPIAPLRAQIMNTDHDEKEWQRVEKLVDKDANVQKSTQIVDGLQKLCWKLSDTVLINN